MSEFSQNKIYCLRQIIHDKISADAHVVRAPKQDRPTSRTLPGLNVLPGIANKERARKVYPLTGCQLIQHPGFRLTARTAVRFIVRAGLHTLNWQGSQDPVIHLPQNRWREKVPGNVRLVTDHEQTETDLREPAKSFGNFRAKPKL
jgi:hypothetical protein